MYGGHTIVNIIEEEEKYSIYIQKGSDVIPWKDFNKNMAIAIEYNIELLMKGVFRFLLLCLKKIGITIQKQ